MAERSMVWVRRTLGKLVDDGAGADDPDLQLRRDLAGDYHLGRQVDKLHGHMQAGFSALLTADGKPQGQRQEQRQEFEALMST